jgi:hypothetical protein
MTPAALALITAVTPPDWAYSALRRPGAFFLVLAIVWIHFPGGDTAPWGAKHSRFAPV